MHVNLLFNGIKLLLILGQTVEQSGISFRKLNCMRDTPVDAASMSGQGSSYVT